MSLIGNTNGGSLPNNSRRAYVTVGAFDSFIYTYTTSISNYVTTGTLTSFTSSGLGNSTTCPQGRILRENGRKLYPGANPSITQFLVGVYDATTLLNGFIDPNARVFAVYTTDKSYFLADSVDAVTGRRDLGPCVVTDGDIRTTQGNVYVEVGNAQINTYVSTGTFVSAGSYVQASTTVTAGTYSYGTLGVGFPTGAGGTVTQATNKSTTVTLNKATGVITTANSNLNNSSATFTLTNSLIGLNDIVFVNTTNTNYSVNARVTAASTCSITVSTGGNLSDAVPIQFIIIKGAQA